MAALKSNEVEIEDEFRGVGADATAGFERVGAPDNSAEFASSEHLDSAGDLLDLAPGKSPKVADPEEDEDEDEEDDLEDDDDLEEDEDEEDDEEEDDLEDDEDDDDIEDDDEELEDDEDDEDELEDDDDLEDDDEEEEEDPVVAPAKGARKKK